MTGTSTSKAHEKDSRDGGAGRLSGPTGVSMSALGRGARETSGWWRLERAAAALALVILGMRTTVHAGVTVGFAVALALLPVWIGVVRRYRTARLLLLGLIATAVWGLVLSEYSVATHQINASQRLGSTVLLVGTTAGIGVVLWARRLFSAATVLSWYGAGLLLGALSTSGGAENPWKFVWAVPVALVLLSQASGRGRRGLELAALALLVSLSAVFDSRSYAGTFAITAILVVWQMRPSQLSRSASSAWTALTMGALAVSIYYVGTTLLVDGYLGKAAQERSISQINTAGSLILGGRPELGATFALLHERPGGFGVGVVPTQSDVLVAKAGMARLNYEPNNGYVERYLFGGHFELHSVFGDMWANWGIPGLATVALMVFLIVRTLSDLVGTRQASAALIFLSTWTLWNSAFSPLTAAQPTLLIALGMTLQRRPDEPPRQVRRPNGLRAPAGAGARGERSARSLLRLV